VRVRIQGLTFDETYTYPELHREFLQRRTNSLHASAQCLKSEYKNCVYLYELLGRAMTELSIGYQSVMAPKPD
jgi:hypothetical protein